MSFLRNSAYMYQSFDQGEKRFKGVIKIVSNKKDLHRKSTIGYLISIIFVCHFIRWSLSIRFICLKEKMGYVVLFTSVNMITWFEVTIDEETKSTKQIKDNGLKDKRLYKLNIW